MEISFENGISKSFMEDMIVSQYQYSGSQIIKFDQMALELDKYEKVENGYLRTDILGDISEVFSDKRIYTIHYIEALGLLTHIQTRGVTIEIIVTLYFMTKFQMMLY